MIPETTWEPTPSDIAWQRQMVHVLTKRATWAVPGTMSVFKIDKDQKTFSLAIGEPNDETNRRIAKVFRLLGFVEEGENKKPVNTNPSIN